MKKKFFKAEEEAKKKSPRYSPVGADFLTLRRTRRSDLHVRIPNVASASCHVFRFAVSEANPKHRGLAQPSVPHPSSPLVTFDGIAASAHCRDRVLPFSRTPLSLRRALVADSSRTPLTNKTPLSSDRDGDRFCPHDDGDGENRRFAALILTRLVALFCLASISHLQTSLVWCTGFSSTPLPSHRRRRYHVAARNRQRSFVQVIFLDGDDDSPTVCWARSGRSGPPGNASGCSHAGRSS